MVGWSGVFLNPKGMNRTCFHLSKSPQRNNFVTSVWSEDYRIPFTEETFRKKVAGKKASWAPELKQLVFGKLGDFESAAKTARVWAKRNSPR